MFQLTHATITINKTTVLSDVTAVFPSSGFAALMGPNGVGKTTLLRTLAGVQPYAGAVNFRDKPLKEYMPCHLKQWCAYYAATPHCVWNMRVEEIITLGQKVCPQSFSFPL